MHDPSFRGQVRTNNKLWNLKVRHSEIDYLQGRFRDEAPYVMHITSWLMRGGVIKESSDYDAVLSLLDKIYPSNYALLGLCIERLVRHFESLSSEKSLLFMSLLKQFGDFSSYALQVLLLLSDSKVIREDQDFGLVLSRLQKINPNQYHTLLRSLTNLLTHSQFKSDKHRHDILDFLTRETWKCLIGPNEAKSRLEPSAEPARNLKIPC